MSRIGKEPIIIPKEVTVTANGSRIAVAGPKGQLTFDILPKLTPIITSSKLELKPKGKLTAAVSAQWGTTRVILSNMIRGVSEGFQKTLKLVGTGFRAKMEDDHLVLSLGFSHPVVFPTPAGIKISVPDQETIIVAGLDKSLVGQVAAKIRSFRPPEPYKGKGIRYEKEAVRKKAGKTGKTGLAGAITK